MFTYIHGIFATDIPWCRIRPLSLPQIPQAIRTADTRLFPVPQAMYLNPGFAQVAVCHVNNPTGSGPCANFTEALKQFIWSIHGEKSYSTQGKPLEFFFHFFSWISSEWEKKKKKRVLFTCVSNQLLLRLMLKRLGKLQFYRNRDLVVWGFVLIKTGNAFLGTGFCNSTILHTLFRNVPLVQHRPCRAGTKRYKFVPKYLDSHYLWVISQAQLQLLTEVAPA